jgi:hypothetical protein
MMKNHPNQIDTFGGTSFSAGNWTVIPLGEMWMQQFKSFDASAFRLEVLQEYAEPSESEAFEVFKREGSTVRAFIADWCELVREHITNGRNMSRVHLVDLPLSDYIRFEIEGAYRHTAQAGEQIFLVDRAKLDPGLLSLGNEDFWLFDDSRVMIQDYDDTGRLMQSRMSQDPELVNYYKDVRDKMLRHAVPFALFYHRATGRQL